MAPTLAQPPPRLTLIRPDAPEATAWTLPGDVAQVRRDCRVIIGCLLISLSLHALVGIAAPWNHRAFMRPQDPIEIDLTGVYEVVPPRIAAMARPVRKATFPPPSAPAITGMTAKSSPETAADSPPDSEEDATNKQTGNLAGIDQGDAEVALVSLTALPQLLNNREVQAMLKKFYPERERLAGHQSRVTLDLHIDAKGIVSRSDIIVSAGEAFDQAALKIASQLQFRPARVGDRPVPVRLRQNINFRLEN